MKTGHVKKYFLEFTEGKLPPIFRKEIKEHLKHCPYCERYYEKMNFVLEEPDLSIFPDLSPDHYLPTRIKAMVEEMQPCLSWRRKFALRVRWMGTMMLIVSAIFLGASLGKWLSLAEKDSEKEIIAGYLQNLTSENSRSLTTTWEDVFEKVIEEK